MYQALFVISASGNFRAVVSELTEMGEFAADTKETLFRDIAVAVEQAFTEDSSFEPPLGFWVFYNGLPGEYKEIKVRPAKVYII